MEIKRLVYPFHVDLKHIWEGANIQMFSYLKVESRYIFKMFDLLYPSENALHSFLTVFSQCILGSQYEHYGTH